MRVRVLKFLLFVGLLAAPAALCAQDLEYKMELGGALGGSFYLGDANYSGLFKDLCAMGGVVARYNLNPRMAVKGNLVAAGISGTTKGSEYHIPGGEGIEFSRTLYDLGAQFECHFFAYGDGSGYKTTKRLAPYIFAGAGMTYAPKPADHVFTLNLPVGLGLKYKIAPRLNLGCELSFRFTLSDKLDVTRETAPILDDPYGIEGGGFKNKDSYSFLTLSVTYDLSPKYRKCNN
jgi:hypothetical protein